MAHQIGLCDDLMPQVAPPPPPKHDFPPTPSFVRQVITVQPVEQTAIPVAVIDPAAHRAQLAQRPRRCLTCQEMFNSTGSGNRICTRCKSSDIFRTPADFSIAASF